MGEPETSGKPQNPTFRAMPGGRVAAEQKTYISLVLAKGLAVDRL
ncbi:hypothetical protein ABIA22_004820, partial [Sinorhizobium fredii]